jgi:hypothetical protein
MIQWILCHLLGHKRVRNAFNGQYGHVPSVWTQEQIEVPLLRTEVLPFCLRCGKKMEA